jgi:tubulin--tyrosine ligase
VQRYLSSLLYKRRKFDIRAFVLVVFFGGKTRAFWFEEGYGRTSSKEFVMGSWGDSQIHLTNDAIQSRFDDYGKYESCNKISFLEVSRLVQGAKGDWPGVQAAMKQLARDAVECACARFVHSRSQAGFELLGLDFLLDRQLKPWLIEVNTNPCLEQAGPLLSRIIPSLLENTLRLTLDPLFLSEEKRWNMTEDSFAFNRYQILF